MTQSQKVVMQMVPIKTNLANKSNYGCIRNPDIIEWIVIHFTSNNGDTAKNNGKYFANNIVKASAHYFVDSYYIVNSVPDNYIAWSVGGNKYPNTKGAKFYGKCVNANSISIELCDDVKNGVVYPSEKTIQNALELTRHLMQKYNIPANHIIRHFDVTGKKCPAYWVDDARWKSEFWNKIQEGEDDMTKEEVIKIIEEYEAAKEKKSVDSWAKSAWDKAKKKGILDGTKPKSPVTREQIAAVLDRLNLL